MLATPATAEEVVAGLSQARVAITAGFHGSEILVFGAVKRTAPIPNVPLDVIVTVQGPSVPVTVRKKDRRFGIWVNTEAIEVDAAPSFYAVRTTGPIDKVLEETEDLRYRVSISQAIRAVDVAEGIEDAGAFTEALVRIRSNDDSYQIRPETIEMSEQTLFRTSIALPSNLTEGDYKTRIFLTREGKVVDVYETTLGVSKVGLERWIYNLAHEKPLIYGLLSLTIAIAAGWGASAIFRYFQS